LLLIYILPLHNEAQANDQALQDAKQYSDHGLRFIDLWQTRDQQGQALVDQGKYGQAANTFESPLHKADALYQSGDYDQAAEQYSATESATAHYNRGNSLAHAGKLQKALAAYDAALSLDPTLQQAKDNRQLIESMLQQAQDQNGQGENSNKQQENPNQDQTQNSGQQDSQSKGDSQQGDQQGVQQGEQSSSNNSDNGRSSPQQDDPSQPSSSNASNPSDSNEQSSANDNAPQTTDDIKAQNDQMNASQEGNNQNSDQDSKTKDDDTTDTNAEQLTEAQQKALAALNQQQSDAQQNDNASENGAAGQFTEQTLSDEEQRSFEQWMRRVPDDPSGLLRRKFEQQSRQRERRPTPEDPLW